MSNQSCQKNPFEMSGLFTIVNGKNEIQINELQKVVKIVENLYTYKC